ncbi:hypothetical protein L9H26_19085 [Morganella psychrotolerans]|uniref:Uncharacterized protein n=1 Tax=Morganella psychrotolerans TaxID=368603 RepID=A0A5M9QZM3_9GAMM|nr:hypothetical protein [Morganella psychrotolerans]KAA8713006.1 hypothetical protein F4V73_17980 [Morganella psychrotolerans]OBU01895.1 hypothetical protein AYY16_16930 [Morganella psychrotolerans]
MVRQAATMPDVRTDECGDVVSQHPSFGIITMNVTNTTGCQLFGSDINHSAYMHFTLQLGQEQKSSEADVYYGKARGNNVKPLIADFSMSMHQFATMITTPNTSSGIPCTLSHYRTGDIYSPPPAIKPAPFHERLSVDVDTAAARELKKLRESVAVLGAMVAKGKAGKKELVELYSDLSSQVGNLPANLSFAVNLAKEAVDETVARGKAEIEATMTAVVMKLGMDRITEIGLESHNDLNIPPVTSSIK